MGSSIYRTTISIPQNLKKRMDSVTAQVNWSAVAAAAFEQELVRIAVKETCERLQASEQEDDAENLDTGKESGEDRPGTPRHGRARFGWAGHGPARPG